MVSATTTTAPHTRRCTHSSSESAALSYRREWLCLRCGRCADLPPLIHTLSLRGEKSSSAVNCAGAWLPSSTTANKNLGGLTTPDLCKSAHCNQNSQKTTLTHSFNRKDNKTFQKMKENAARWDREEEKRVQAKVTRLLSRSPQTSLGCTVPVACQASCTRSLCRSRAGSGDA